MVCKNYYQMWIKKCVKYFSLIKKVSYIRLATIIILPSKLYVIMTKKILKILAFQLNLVLHTNSSVEEICVAAI